MTKKFLLLAAMGMALGSLASVQGQSFLTNGLVAYYPFNGNANDQSGNGLNGTVYNATLAADRFNRPNRAYSFPGVNSIDSYIDFGRPVGLQFTGDFTVSAWARFSGGETNPRIISYAEGFGFEVYTELTGASRRVTCSVAQSLTTTTTYYPQNTWHMIVLTRQGSTIGVYVNGSVAAVGQAQSAISYPYNLQIGKKSQHWDDHWGGQIDDVRIYSRALASSEVAALYDWELRPVSGIGRSVYYTADNLLVGSNYQLQISSNSQNWTNWGPVFTATNAIWRAPYYWDVEDWSSLYFRMRQR